MPVKLRGRRGQVMIVLALAMTFLVSLAGMAVDTIFVFVVKTALVTATDSCVLGAARALGRGANGTMQQAEVSRVANLLFDSNFPDSTLLTGNTGQLVAPGVQVFTSLSPTPAWMQFDPTVPAGQREIRVASTASVPTFFMRIFGVSAVNVGATAVSARRDVNIVLVIDRSASLHPTRADAWDDVQNASTYFINQFDNETDRLGVVSFGSGANIDYAAASGFKTGDAAANVIWNQTVPSSAGTNSPQGLWLGYRELLRVNDGSALNAIVFFTDGQPSGYSNVFPVKTAGTQPRCDATPMAAAIATTQPGAYFNDILLFTNPIAGPPPVNGGSTTSDHPTLANCTNFTTNAGNVELVFAPNSIPSTWQVSSTAGNKTFSLVTGPYTGVNTSDPRMYTNAGGADALFRGQQVHDSAKNLSVNVAQTARQDASIGNVRVYSIGLGGWGYPADHDFLRLVSNDSAASTTYSNEPEGLYVYSPSPAQLQQAFQSVAREIFRLIL